MPPKSLPSLTGWRTSLLPCTRTLTCEWGEGKGLGGQWPPAIQGHHWCLQPVCLMGIPSVPLEQPPVGQQDLYCVFFGLDLDLLPGWCGDTVSPSAWSCHHLCPHRIIATPGRLVHVAVEMKLKLHTVEYVVFDEADRSAGHRGVPRAGSVPTWVRCPGRGREGPATSHIPSPAGSSRWASLSSSRRSSPGSQTATRPCCSLPRCPSCSSSLPGLVRNGGQVALGTGTQHSPAARPSPALGKQSWINAGPSGCP